MPRLTAIAVKNAKPGRHADGDGLYLLVKPSGSKSWMLRVQFEGKRHDFGLGGASLFKSLNEVRERAAEYRKLAKVERVDPAEHKRRARAERAAIPTFKAAAESCHGEQKAGWRNVKHRADWLSSLDRYAFASIGNLPVDQVDGPAIRDLLLPIWLDKPETARRVKQRVGAVLDWAHAKGFRPTEAPTRSINKGLPRQPKKGDRHYAAMPYAAVPAFMDKLAEQTSAGRLALRFVILTAARSGEVRGATWDEIDLQTKVWTVPGSRMKAGREHMVPLSEAACEVLTAAEAMKANRKHAPVFPGMKGKSLSDMSLLKALRVNGGIGLTVHGFRSSFRDWAAECTNTAGDVVEAALAHSVANKVEAAYRRTNYLEKRRGLMDAWANYLTRRTADILPLAERRTG